MKASKPERLNGRGAAAVIEARYLTLREAGLYCGGRSPEAMRQMARRGLIPVIKQGKRTFMDKVDIDSAMTRNKQ